MTDPIHDDSRAERDRIDEQLRAELAQIEASLPPMQRLWTTWAIRVAVFTAIAVVFVTAREENTSWIFPAVAFYALFSLALAFFLRRGHRRQIEKARARIIAARKDMDDAMERQDD